MKICFIEYFINLPFLQDLNKQEDTIPLLGRKEPKRKQKHILIQSQFRAFTSGAFRTSFIPIIATSNYEVLFSK